MSSRPVTQTGLEDLIARGSIDGNRRVRFTSNVLRSLGIVSDAIVFVTAFAVSIVLYDLLIDRYYNFRLHETAAIVMAINFLLLRISRDAYSNFRGQGEDVGQGALLDLIVAATLTIFTVILFGLGGYFSRGLTLIFIGTSLGLLFFGRMVFRRVAWKLMDLGFIGQQVVIYGANKDVTARTLELLEIERLPHLKVIGFADDRHNRVEQAVVGTTPYVGGLEELVSLAQQGIVDQVIIALPNVQQRRLDEIVEQLSAVAVDMCILPRELLELRKEYGTCYLGSLPVLAVWTRRLRDIDGLLKDIQDRTLALIGLLVLSPLLILTALAIRLESKGPILFTQKRFGFNNVEIEVLKFRSMYTDRQDVSGTRRTRKNDPRVTRVGRIIRRLSIDELPQLINVLRGQMSLVGPRPHATQMKVGDKFYFDAVRGYASRHRVKPGITGLAQVRGLRGEIDTVERARKRVEYDIYYIENWSPLFDLRIILETFFKIFWDRNAY